MDLTKKTEIKNLLKKYNAKPEKYLGQHFILSKKALTLMIAAAEIKTNDRIVEIGPGLGTLTQKLATAGREVITIEKDPLMIEILKETLASHNNVRVIQADARKAEFSGVRLRRKSGKTVDKYKYKIVANLPYNVATFLIRRWLELKKIPELIVLMIQKEVAQRMVAKSPHSNLLSTSIQFYADAKIIDYVKKESFWPRPKVNAAIIKIVPKKSPPQKTRNAFFAAVKAGFSQPRKQLIGNLTKKSKIPREKLILIFKYLSISEQARAENLTLEQWRLLANNFHSFSRGNKTNF